VGVGGEGESAALLFLSPRATSNVARARARARGGSEFGSEHSLSQDPRDRMDAPRSGNDLAAIDRRTADRQRSSRHALARPPRDDLVRKSRETDRGEIRETPESTRERESERERERERERRGGEGRGEDRRRSFLYVRFPRIRAIARATRERAAYPTNRPSADI